MRWFKHKKNLNQNNYPHNPQSYPQQEQRKKHIPKLDAQTAYSFKGKIQQLVKQYAIRFKMPIPLYEFAFNINLAKQDYYLNVVKYGENQYLVELNPNLALESQKESLLQELAKRIVFKLSLLSHNKSAKENSPDYIFLCHKYNVFNYNNLPECSHPYFIMRCRECREPFFIFLKRPNTKTINNLLSIELPYHKGQDYSKSDKVHKSQLSQVSQEEMTNSQAQFYFERMNKVIAYQKKVYDEKRKEFENNFS